MLLALALLVHTSLATPDLAPPPSRFGEAPSTPWSGRSAHLIRTELAQVKLELENNQPHSVLATFLGTLLGGGAVAAGGGILWATTSCGGSSAFLAAGCGLGLMFLTGAMVITGALIVLVGIIASLVMAGSNSSRAQKRERLMARQAELQAELELVDPPWSAPPPPPRTPVRRELPGAESGSTGLISVPL